MDWCVSGLSSFSSKNCSTANCDSSTPSTGLPCAASQIMSSDLPQSGTSTLPSLGTPRVGQYFCSSGVTRD